MDDLPPLPEPTFDNLATSDVYFSTRLRLVTEDQAIAYAREAIALDRAKRDGLMAEMLAALRRFANATVVQGQVIGLMTEDFEAARAVIAKSTQEQKP